MVVQSIINCPIQFWSLYIWHEHTVHCWIGCLWSAWMKWDFIFLLIIRTCAFLMGLGISTSWSGIVEVWALTELFTLGIFNINLQYQAKGNLFSLCLKSCAAVGILTVVYSGWVWALTRVVSGLLQGGIVNLYLMCNLVASFYKTLTHLYSNSTMLLLSFLCSWYSG